MSKKRITYISIMALLFIANLYLVYAFLGEEGFVGILLISLLIATLSSKISKWIVNKIYKSDPKSS